MLPAREILRRAALRSISNPHDPLDVAKEVGIQAPHVADWYVVAQFSVPAVMGKDGERVLKPAGTLSILSNCAAGAAEGDSRGLILNYDRGSERECVRLSPDGVPLAVIVGIRRAAIDRTEERAAEIGFGLAEGTSEPWPLKSTADEMVDLVDRVVPGAVFVRSSTNQARGAIEISPAAVVELVERIVTSPAAIVELVESKQESEVE